MIGIESLVSIVVTLLIAGCVIGLLFYLISIVPVPQPYKQWIFVVLNVLVVLFLIGLLISYGTGQPLVRFR